MTDGVDPIAHIIHDEHFRPTLEELGRRLNITQGEVLVMALAIVAHATDEREEGRAKLLLQYPTGDYSEIVFWKPETGPRLVAVGGKLLNG